MINLKERLETINNLLATATEQSLTYAALECRLTIELICYDRFISSNKYISYKDLKDTYKPRHVVQQVVAEANEHASSEFTFCVSDAPVKKGCEPRTKEEYEKFNYVRVGTQSSLPLKKLDSLWQSLSNLALHLKIPKEKNEDLKIYSECTSLRKKIVETIEVIEAISKGNLTSSAFGESYSFDCLTCGTKLQRQVSLIKDQLIVNCMLPACNESYTLHKEGQEILYSRRVAIASCQGCSKENEIPQNEIERLRIGIPLVKSCLHCSKDLIIDLVPLQRVNGSNA